MTFALEGYSKTFFIQNNDFQSSLTNQLGTSSHGSLKRRDKRGHKKKTFYILLGYI